MSLQRTFARASDSFHILVSIILRNRTVRTPPRRFASCGACTAIVPGGWRAQRPVLGVPAGWRMCRGGARAAAAAARRERPAGGLEGEQRGEASVRLEPRGEAVHADLHVPDVWATDRCAACRT